MNWIERAAKIIAIILDNTCNSFFEINEMKVSFYIHDLREVSKLQVLISVPKKKIKSSGWEQY